MKTMILSTLMCILMITSVSAQDSIVADKSRKEKARVELRRSDKRHFTQKHHSGEKNMERKKSLCDKRDKLHLERTPEQRAMFKAKFFTERLTLTQKQSDKLYEVFLAEAQSMEKNKAEFDAKDENAKREAIIQQRSETDKKVKKILTKEEFAKYLEIRDADHHRGSKHNKRGN